MKNLIDKYISNLTVDHIKKYASSKDIFITNEEAIIIHNFIINNYTKLIENEDTILLLKPYIREDLFTQVLKEYIENKTKYL